MKTAFVTGATGFIGRSLVKKLLERGYRVRALARSDAGADRLRAMGAQPIPGDLRNLDAIRSAARGCDLVIHAAGWYKLGARDQSPAYSTNVEGTQNVLSIAYQEGVPRIVYISTVAVYGDTAGRMVDETHPATGGSLVTEYDRTKWLAHRAAEGMIDQGAPVIIVMPGAVFGPGDPSLVGDLMRAYLRGLFPVVIGPELTLTYTHVDDVAEGILLAAEKGRPGESYFLTGPAVSLGKVMRRWADLTGHPRPRFDIPARFVKPLAPVVSLTQTFLPMPPILSLDAVLITDVTYLARADKAQRELGWTPRPLDDGFRETLASMDRPRPQRMLTPPRDLEKWLVGISLGALVLWLLTRRLSKKRRC